MEAREKIAPKIITLSPVLPFTVSFPICYIIVIMEGEREQGKERFLLPAYANTGTVAMPDCKKKMFRGLGDFFFSPKPQSYRLESVSYNHTSSAYSEKFVSSEHSMRRFF